MPKTKPKKNNQIVEGKVLALLAYLPFFCILPLLFKKDNDFILSHGKQGLVLFVGEIGIFIIHIIPLFHWIFRFGMFVLLALAFWGIIAVLKGRFVELPVVARIAAKITL